MSGIRLELEGHIRTRALPFATHEEFLYWWVDEKDEAGRVLRPARMSQREKDRYTVAESHNLITANGINNVLTFLGLASGTAVLFFKYLSVGTGTLSGVASGDTGMVTELFRKVPSGTSINGNQQDVSVAFGTTEGNGTWTNIGIWGNAATATLGSGTLMTHALYSYTKSSAFSVTNDYLLLLTAS